MEGKPAARNMYTDSRDTPHTDMINNPPTPLANPLFISGSKIYITEAAFLFSVCDW